MILFAQPLKHFLTNTIKSAFDRLVFRPNTSLDTNEIAIVMSAFECGKDIQLGALSFSQEGINLEETIIPWSALRTVRVADRHLVLVKQFGNHFESHRIPLQKIQHLPIALELLHMSRANIRQTTGIG